MPPDNDHLQILLDDTVQGVAHLFCALVETLETAGSTTRADVRRALHDKVDWLAAHGARDSVASVLMLAEDWLTHPPHDPADPFEGRPRATVLPFPPRPRTRR